MSGATLTAWSEARMPSITAGRLLASERDTALVLIGGQRLMRAAVGGLIDAQPGMRVTSSLASIEALEEVFELAPPRVDVALLDVDDHRGTCAEAVDRVLALELSCKLVLLATEATSEVVLCASTRRVDGVVLKESSVGELRAALTHILNGHAVLPASWHAAPELVAITPRQLEVLQLMALGHSNEEIAELLGLRPNTIKFHVSDIFRRLGVRNRIEAISQLETCEAPLR
ncbi:MAG TPA: response regulator transcription factor [Solirubrobacteraceae bacterium]|jgi:DNA-binding NarL/FixJ family response regulator